MVTTVTIKVPDWGSPDSKIVLIGEAPGRVEVEQGMPFVGLSGLLLKDWWTRVGLDRTMFYIMNTYPFRPPDNEIGKVPKSELEHYAQLMKERLDALPDVWVIVPTGRTALYALTGKTSITDWRGSLLEYSGIKVIPTLHPAAVMRMKSWEARCIADWGKIAQQAKFKGMSLPDRRHFINPSISECNEFLNMLEPGIPLAIDIETHPEQGITCVGFAQTADFSFTIPLGVKKILPVKRRKTKEEKDNETEKHNARISKAVFHTGHPLEESLSKRAEIKALGKWQEQRKPLKTICRIVEEWEKDAGMEVAPWTVESQQFVTVGYWKTEEENQHAFSVIKKLVESDNPKIFHNGFYDVYWLEQWAGFKVRHWQWDTMYMHHCIDPVEEHSLDFLASIFTWEPFWKKEAKEAVESKRYTSSLYTYNGKDVCVTWELFPIFHKILKDRGMLPFYAEHYRRMQAPLMAITKTGIKMDLEKRSKRKTEFQDELQGLLLDIGAEVGRPLHGKTNLSSKKVQKYLYEDLKLPRQMRKRSLGEKTPTADETAIRTLMLKFPEKFAPLGTRILRCQRLGKLLGFLKDTKLDPDGRMRSSYKFNTTTGRLASGSNPFGTGDNAQNQDREMRDLYIAG